MSEIWWNLSGTDKHCDLYGGHWVHWIQYFKSVREPGPVIPVTVSVDDDGVVLLEGDRLSLERWNHRPALMRAALLRSVGIKWKPRWNVLGVPTTDLVGGASNVFSLVLPDQRSECSVTRTTNPDHLVPSVPSPTNTPPLRIAARYAAGRPRPNGNVRD